MISALSGANIDCKFWSNIQNLVPYNFEIEIFKRDQFWFNQQRELWVVVFAVQLRIRVWVSCVKIEGVKTTLNPGQLKSRSKK